MMEMMVGLVISSLVISMVYIIYENISKQVSQYYSDQNELMEYNQFQSLFSKDIRLAKGLQIINDNQIIVDLFSEKATYFFEKDYILRKTKVLDTFHIKVVALEVGRKDEITSKNKNIRLKTELLDQEIIIFEEKEIALAERLNRYLLIEH